MQRCLKISRPDLGESHVIFPITHAKNAIEAETCEIVDWAVGDSLLLEIVELEDGEIEKLPEFEGW